MMRVSSVEFIGTFGYPNKLPRDRRPEVALFGRSNVGKSSLINTLLNRRGVARISKTPGKTRGANYFRINDRFYFVDMPGYGYAKVSKSEIARWAQIYDLYIADENRNNALALLLDIRHDPTTADKELASRLSATSRPLCLVFNKSDKVKPSRIKDRVGEIVAHLDVDDSAAAIPFSSVSGRGKRELWGWIRETLSI
jgi:GTP-binding protein